jgi:hypothetical protein
MQCDVCGAEVGPEQRFCMDCGARLNRSGPADPTPAPPLELAPPGGHPMFDPVTGQLLSALPPPPPRSVATDRAPVDPAPIDAAASDPDATRAMPLAPVPFAPPDPTPAGGVGWSVPDEHIPLWPGETYPTRRQAVERSVSAVPPTMQMPGGYAAYPTEAWDGDGWDDGAAARPSFRVKPLLVLTILTVVAVGVAIFTDVIHVGAQQSLGGPWKVNDFGTNLTVAGLVSCLFMLAGALAWCGGYRWGAGLAGGAGTGLAGWAALVIGLAELPLAQADRVGIGWSRELGYWALIAAGGLGLVTFVVSLTRVGNDGRAGLDPWVAALGAMAAIAAAVGPLIPVGSADVTENYSSPSGLDWPTLFFAARLAQLGLLLMCGVFGFLLVRRYGLGLAIGGTVVSGWLVLTAATEQTDFPIGPAQTNPGAAGYATVVTLVDAPHAVTVVGVGLVFFFGLVATAMALIDN